MIRPTSSKIARLLGLALVASLVAVASAWSSSGPGPVARQDDDERAFVRQQARQSFVENCLMCHGEDMTSRQRLTTKQWTAEVEKMVNWGSPLPPDRKQPLIDHLSETYPSTQPSPPIERIKAGQALAGDAQASVTPLPKADLGRGETLFGTHCAVCHGPGAKGGELGINLVEKPVLLREAEFRTLLKEGRRRMPGFASVVDEASQTDLLAWLRRQR